MNYAMVLNYQNCINCRACEVACKEENNVELGAGKQRIWVAMNEDSFLGVPRVNFYPSQCNHCIDAPCVAVCPTEASHIIDGGIVMVDYDKCILCKGCMEACPYDARYVNDEKIAVDKCTFCYDTRISKGETTTACQTTCPTKVRTFGDLDDPNSAIVKLLKENKFYVLKERESTVPKLFYIVPQDKTYARDSIGKDVEIHTWDEFKPVVEAAKEKRSKEWVKYKS